MAQFYLVISLVYFHIKTMGFWYKKNGQWYYRRMWRKDEDTAMVTTLPAAVYASGGFPGSDVGLQAGRRAARVRKALGGLEVAQSRLRRGLAAEKAAYDRPRGPIEEAKVARVQKALGGVDVPQSSLQRGLIDQSSALRVPRRTERTTELNLVAPIAPVPIEEIKEIDRLVDEEVDAHQPDEFPSFPQYLDESEDAPLMVDEGVPWNVQAKRTAEFDREPKRPYKGMHAEPLGEEEVKDLPLSKQLAAIPWAHPDEYVRGQLTAADIKAETEDLQKRLEEDIIKQLEEEAKKEEKKVNFNNKM